MRNPENNPAHYVKAISKSGLSIYDPIEIDNLLLWIPTPDLEQILNIALTGKSLDGLPLRTRSKVAKQFVCEALGYPVPASFKKTQPRFPGQIFDTYVQKSNNLQIWNEDLAYSRRYVIIRIDENSMIIKVKVVTGDQLARLDTTGTLTQKYQARLDIGQKTAELVSNYDTDLLFPLMQPSIEDVLPASPVDDPKPGQLIPIRDMFSLLQSLIGKEFPDLGHDQERNRGAALHKLVCHCLGYASYRDDGQFPDVRHQLLEVKLQTSPTIDLGLVRPDSSEILNATLTAGHHVRHCDVRYALFYGTTNSQIVKLTHLFLTTGESFFKRFPQFQGNVLNKKLQIPLPTGFFDS